MHGGVGIGVLLLIAIIGGTQQGADALTEALRPVLPFPAADADGELPADQSAAAKWFVVWPEPGAEPRVVVKANPLNLEVQQAGAEAMARINAAVAAAERRAQENYERALDEIRRTGKSADVDGITLDDEGVEGARIDAEMELVIERLPAEPFHVHAGEAPQVAPATNGPAWIVSVPAHVYAVERDGQRREQFRAAESWLVFGNVPAPAVQPGTAPASFRVGVPAGALSVVAVRGNPELLAAVVTGARWTAMVPR